MALGWWATGMLEAHLKNVGAASQDENQKRHRYSS
jgi:hypothetical protein